MKLEYTKDFEMKLELDSWDTWSLDRTLAQIIAPCLKQLRDTTHGSPLVDMEDVPKYLRTRKRDEFDVDDHWHERWNWVLNEMIWTFESLIEDSDRYIYEDEVNDRIKNGLRLFGKYYRSLWD